MSANSAHLAIVLPVYNTEKYLASCLDSLRNQSSQNFTVYAIDDGSTDGSGSLLDELSGDSRFVVIHKTNGGVSDARNKGIELAEKCSKNTFISFIDSDDYLSDKYVETCLNYMSRGHQIDYAAFAYQMFDKTGFIHKKVKELSVTNLDQEQIVEHYFRGAEPTQHPQDLTLGRFLCNKVFRLNTIRGMRFETKLSCGEDQDFFIRSLPKLKKGLLIPDILYFYRLRLSSLSHSPCPVQADINPLEKLYFANLPLSQSAREGIKLSLLNSWWQETRRVYETGASISDRKKRRMSFERLQNMEDLYPLPRKHRKRFLFMKFGDWFLRIYFALGAARKRKDIDSCSYFE